MRENMRILCIDFDDVIFKTKPIIEEKLRNIEEKATEEYLHSIINDKKLDAESRDILRLEHFDYKDRILEEVDDEHYNNLTD